MANLVAVVAGVQDANLSFTFSDVQNNGAPVQYVANQNHLGPSFGTQTSVFGLSLQSQSNTYISTYQEAYGTPRSLSPPTSLNTPTARKTQRVIEELDGYKARHFSHGSSSPRFLKDYRVSEDAFAESLRKYPASISAHIIQQLLAYTQSKNAQKRVIHNRRSHIKRGSHLKRVSNKNIQTYTRSRNRSPLIDAADFYGNPIKRKRAISPEEKDANDEGPESSSYDYLMIDSFLSQKPVVMYLSDVNRYVRDTFREVCNNDNLLCSDLMDRYCIHKKQCNLAKASVLNKENSRTEPRPDFKTWRFPTPGYSSFDNNNRPPIKTMSDSIRMKILELKEKTSATCKTLQPYDFNLEEDNRSEIETKSLTSIVGLWIQTVPIIPKKSLVQEDLVKMLIKKINVIASDSDPKMLPAIVTNAVFEELKKLQVLCSSVEKFEFARKLAQKVAELPKKGNRLSQIVQNWVRTLPFGASTPVNIENFATKLTINLKNLKKVKQTKPKALKNIILKTLYEINLNCDDTKREKLADELISEIDDFSEHESILLGAKKTTEPLNEVSELDKAYDNLFPVKQNKIPHGALIENLIDNLKKSAENEVYKIGIESKKIIGHNDVTTTLALNKEEDTTKNTYDSFLDNETINEILSNAKKNLGDYRKTYPYRPKHDLAYKIPKSEESVTDSLIEKGHEKHSFSEIGEMSENKNALLIDFFKNLEKSARNHIKSATFIPKASLDKKVSKFKAAIVLDKNMNNQHKKDYKNNKIPNMDSDENVVAKHERSSLGYSANNLKMSATIRKRAPKITGARKLSQNTLPGLSLKKINQNIQEYIETPLIYGKSKSNILKTERERHEAQKSLKIDNNLMATRERALLGDFLHNLEKSANFKKKYPAIVGHQRLPGNVITRKRKTTIKLPKQTFEIVSQQKSLGSEDENITEKLNSLLGDFLYNLEKSASIKNSVVGIATDESLPDNVLRGKVQSTINLQKQKNAEHKIDKLRKKEDENYKNLITVTTDDHNIITNLKKFEKSESIYKSFSNISADKTLAHMNKTLHPRPEKRKIAKKKDNLLNKYQRHKVLNSNNIYNALRNHKKTEGLRKSLFRLATSKKIPENATSPGQNKIDMPIRSLYTGDQKNESRNIVVKEIKNRKSKGNGTFKGLDENSHADINRTEKQKTLIENFLYSLKKSACVDKTVIENAADQKTLDNALQGSKQTGINPPKKSQNNYETLDTDKNINERLDRPILSDLLDDFEQSSNIKIKTETAVDEKSPQNGRITSYEKYSGEAVLDQSTSLSRTNPKNKPDKRLPENLLSSSVRTKINNPKMTLGKNLPIYRAPKISNEKIHRKTLETDENINTKHRAHKVALTKSELRKITQTVPKYGNMDENKLKEHNVELLSDFLHSFEKSAENIINRSAKEKGKCYKNISQSPKTTTSSDIKSVLPSLEQNKSLENVKYLETPSKKNVDLLDKEYESASMDENVLAKRKGASLDKSASLSSTKPKNEPDKRLPQNLLTGSEKTNVNFPIVTLGKNVPKYRAPKISNEINSLAVNTDENINTKHGVHKVAPQDILKGSEQIKIIQTVPKYNPLNITKKFEIIPHQNEDEQYATPKIMEIDENITAQKIEKYKTPNSSREINYNRLEKDDVNYDARKIVDIDENIVTKHNVELLSDFLHNLEKSAENIINSSAKEKGKGYKDTSQCPKTTIASKVKSVLPSPEQNNFFQKGTYPEITIEKIIDLREKEYESANIDENLLAKLKGAVLDESASLSRSNAKNEPDVQLSKNLLKNSEQTEINIPKITLGKNVSRYAPKISNEIINRETVETDENMNTKRHGTHKIAPQNKLTGPEKTKIIQTIPKYNPLKITDKTKHIQHKNEEGQYAAPKIMKIDENVMVENIEKYKNTNLSSEFNYDRLKKGDESYDARKTVDTDEKIVTKHNVELLSDFLHNFEKSADNLITRSAKEKQKGNINISQSPENTIASEVKSVLPISEQNKPFEKFKNPETTNEIIVDLLEKEHESANGNKNFLAKHKGAVLDESASLLRTNPKHKHNKQLPEKILTGSEGTKINIPKITLGKNLPKYKVPKLSNEIINSPTDDNMKTKHRAHKVEPQNILTGSERRKIIQTVPKYGNMDENSKTKHNVELLSDLLHNFEKSAENVINRSAKEKGKGYKNISQSPKTETSSEVKSVLPSIEQNKYLEKVKHLETPSKKFVDLLDKEYESGNMGKKMLGKRKGAAYGDNASLFKSNPKYEPEKRLPQKSLTSSEQTKINIPKITMGKNVPKYRAPKISNEKINRKTVETDYDMNTKHRAQKVTPQNVLTGSEQRKIIETIPKQGNMEENIMKKHNIELLSDFLNNFEKSAKNIINSSAKKKGKGYKNILQSSETTLASKAESDLPRPKQNKSLEKVKAPETTCKKIVDLLKEEYESAILEENMLAKRKGAASYESTNPKNEPDKQIPQNSLLGSGQAHNVGPQNILKGSEQMKFIQRVPKYTPLKITKNFEIVPHENEDEQCPAKKIMEIDKNVNKKIEKYKTSNSSSKINYDQLKKDVKNYHVRKTVGKDKNTEMKHNVEPFSDLLHNFEKSAENVINRSAKEKGKSFKNISQSPKATIPSEVKSVLPSSEQNKSLGKVKTPETATKKITNLLEKEYEYANMNENLLAKRKCASPNESESLSKTSPKNDVHKLLPECLLTSSGQSEIPKLTLEENIQKYKILKNANEELNSQTVDTDENLNTKDRTRKVVPQNISTGSKQLEIIQKIPKYNSLKITDKLEDILDISHKMEDEQYKAPKITDEDMIVKNIKKIKTPKFFSKINYDLPEKDNRSYKVRMMNDEWLGDYDKSTNDKINRSANKNEEGNNNISQCPKTTTASKVKTIPFNEETIAKKLISSHEDMKTNFPNDMLDKKTNYADANEKRPSDERVTYNTSNIAVTGKQILPEHKNILIEDFLNNFKRSARNEINKISPETFKKIEKSYIGPVDDDSESVLERKTFTKNSIHFKERELTDRRFLPVDKVTNSKNEVTLSGDASSSERKSAENIIYETGAELLRYYKKNYKLSSTAGETGVREGDGNDSKDSDKYFENINKQYYKQPKESETSKSDRNKITKQNEYASLDDYSKNSTKSTNNEMSETKPDTLKLSRKDNKRVGDVSNSAQCKEKDIVLKESNREYEGNKTIESVPFSSETSKETKRKSSALNFSSFNKVNKYETEDNKVKSTTKNLNKAAADEAIDKKIVKNMDQNKLNIPQINSIEKNIRKYEEAVEAKKNVDNVNNKVHKNCTQIVHDDNALSGHYMYNDKKTEENKTTNDSNNFLRISDDRAGNDDKHIFEKYFENQINEKEHDSNVNIFGEPEQKVTATDKSCKKDTQQEEKKLIASEENLAIKLKEAFEKNVSDWIEGSLAPESKTIVEDMDVKRIIKSLPKVLVDYELQDEDSKDIRQQMYREIYENIENISKKKSIEKLTKHKLAKQLLDKIAGTIDRVIFTIEEHLPRDLGSTSAVQNYHDKVKIWFENIPEFQTTDKTNKYKCKKLLRDLTKNFADTHNSNLNENDQRKKNLSVIKNKLSLVSKRNKVSLDPDTINKYASKLLDVLANETQRLPNLKDQPYKINKKDNSSFNLPPKIIHSVPSNKVEQNVKKNDISKVLQKQDISRKANLDAKNERDHAKTSTTLDSNVIENKFVNCSDCESLKRIDSSIWKLVQSNVQFSPGDVAKKREKVNELLKSLQTIQRICSTEDMKKTKMINYIYNWMKEISKSANKPFEEKKNNKLVTEIVNGILSSTKATKPGRINKDLLASKATVGRFSSSDSEVFYLEGSLERQNESKSLDGIKDICREINEKLQSKMFSLITHNLDYLDVPENEKKLKKEVLRILVDDAKVPEKKGEDLTDSIFQKICKQSENYGTKFKEQLLHLRQKIRRVMSDYPIDKENRDVLEIYFMDMQACKMEGTFNNDIDKDVLSLVKEKGHLNHEDAEEMLHKLDENIKLHLSSSPIYKLSSSNSLIKDPLKSMKGNRGIPNKTDSTKTSRQTLEKDKHRYVDRYTHGLKEAIKQWIDNLPLESNIFYNEKFKNTMINDLVEDVIDWENELHHNPNGKTSEAEERETLKNKCHIWMNKLFNGNNLTVALSHTNELVESIREVCVPVFGSEATSSKALENEIFAWINNLPIRTNHEENNHDINQYVKDLAKIILIHKGDPDAEKKISHEISKVMQSICQNLVDLESKDLESSFFNNLVKKEITYYDTRISFQNPNEFAQESFNNAILGWLQQSPIYQVASPDVKRRIEEAAFKMAKSVRDAILVPYNPDTNIDELLLGKINAHLKFILPDLEFENYDDIRNNIANIILNYFKGQQIFKDWTGRSEPLGNVDLLAFSVDDWVSKLPIDTKTVQEREVLNDYKMKLVSRLKQARYQFHPTTPQHEQAIRDESRKFLRTHITDLYKKLDKEYIEKMASNLVNTLIGVPIERLDTTRCMKLYKSPSDTLYEYIEEWINNFPVQGEGIKLNLTKQNLASKFVNKIGEMNMSPDIFNDINLYKDLLQDEIDKLIEEIPVNPDMIKYMPALKHDFISKIMAARDKISEELAGKVYKQHLRDKISDLLPLPSALTLEVEALLELLKDKIADDFINIRFAGNDEILTDRCMENMTDELNRFCRTIINDPCAQLDIDKLKKDLHEGLEGVSMPRDDTMKLEVEQAKIRNLINEWMKDLPLRQETASERLHRYKLAAVLAKRIHHIEMEKLCNDFIDSEPKLYEEISRFLNKNFIKHDQEHLIPKHVQNLINLIYNSEQSRKFISTSENIYSRYPCTLSLEDQDHLKRIKERRRNTCINAISCFLPTSSCKQTSYESLCLNQQTICPEVIKPEKRDASTLTSIERAFEYHTVPRAAKKECICNPLHSQDSQTMPPWLAERAPFPYGFSSPMEQMSGSHNSCLITPFAGRPSLGRQRSSYEYDYSPLRLFPQVGAQTSLKVPCGSHSRPDVEKTTAEPRDEYSAKSMLDPHTWSRFAEKDMPCQYGRPCTVDSDSESSEENENYPIAETRRFSRSQFRESCIGVKQSRLFERNEKFWNPCSRQHGRKDNNKCDCTDRILLHCKGNRNRYIDTCQACGAKCPHPTSLLFK